MSPTVQRHDPVPFAVRVVVPFLLVLLAATSAAAPAARRNLLLITLDTFRADYLGVNGASEVPTPHLDALARGGVNFTRARAPVPLTLPSHASILTGTYPPGHGVRDNGSFRLADERLTLAEVLGERGYATAAFVASFVLDRRFGLAQGFALYDDRITSDPAMLESLEAERSGEAVLAAFSRWLGERHDAGPFFAWLHLYDPHAPYLPPEPFRSRYARHPYGGEIAYTDQVVGRIVEALESRQLLDSTILAVVGDHGEDLGEHGETTHALLIYNSTLHVPMILRAPGLLPAGVQLGELVRIIDLAPTLLDLLGLPADFGEGASLRPLVVSREAGDSRPPNPARSAYSESLYAQLNLGWSPLHGLEAGDFHLILAPEPELFALADDPAESINRAATRREDFGRMRSELLQILERDTDRAPEASVIAEPAAVEKLRSLGYLSASPSPRSPRRSARPVDPKTKIAVWERLQLAMAQFGSGDFRAAAATLQEVLAAERDIPLLYEYLGSSFMRLEEWSNAERVYRQALERGVESAALRVDLGLIHAQRGDFLGAERELLAALSLDELSVAAHYRLADLYRSRRRHGEAVEHYRRALAVNPRYVYAWNGLGRALAALSQNDEALAAFEEAVAVAPRSTAGFFNLGVQLEHMDRKQRALAAYRQCLSLSLEEPLLAPQRQRAAEAIRRLGQVED